MQSPNNSIAELDLPPLGHILTDPEFEMLEGDIDRENILWDFNYA